MAPLGAGEPAARPLTREEYMERHTPRIDFQPWSAPVFDDRSVQSQPELYCMAFGTTVADTTCTCVTEQGTKAKVRLQVSVAIARDGSTYNPYRAPRQVDSGSQPQPQLASTQVSPASPSDLPGAFISVGQRPMPTFPESVQNRYSGSGP
jgi:hypothetical protein